MQLRSGKSYSYSKVMPKKRRVVKKTSSPTVSKVARQVRRLNYKVAGETKYFDITPKPELATVAQLVDDGTGPIDLGWYMQDVTPRPSQGTGDHDRIGNQIKLKSFQLRFQAEQQKQLTSAMRLKAYLVRVMGSPLDIGNPIPAMARFLEANPMSTFTDYHSIRNTSFYKEFKVIAKKDITIAPDTIRYDTTGDSASQIVDVDLFRKCNYAVRWDTYNPDALANGQLLLIIVASTGNSGSGNYTGNQVFNGQANFGCNFNFALRWNFTDK